MWHFFLVEISLLWFHSYWRITDFFDFAMWADRKSFWIRGKPALCMPIFLGDSRLALCCICNNMVLWFWLVPDPPTVTVLVIFCVFISLAASWDQSVHIPDVRSCSILCVGKNRDSSVRQVCSWLGGVDLIAFGSDAIRCVVLWQHKATSITDFVSSATCWCFFRFKTLIFVRSLFDQIYRG